MARSVEQLGALLSPPPGGALHHVLHNLSSWAHGLDAHHNLKVRAQMTATWP